ncbi:glycosyltransferase family 4 protein [Pseudomonadota bacterium]
MNIAITVDPEIPVPPRFYGGIERIVYLLASGLVERGHSVTLFANGASNVPCRLIPWTGRNSQSLFDCVKNMHLASSSAMREKYDVVHCFSRLAYVWPLLVAGMRIIMTYQRPITKKSIVLGNMLSRNNIRYTAVGKHLTTNLPGNWKVIPNGVDTHQFRYNPSVLNDAPLAFLGRIEHIKGVHLAIQVAKRSRRRLIIMGNLEDEHSEFFDTQIKPHLGGRDIVFIGAVDDAAKSDLLGSSAALLMPILWDEPFGIVMVESLACGTPVIGLNRASVPEVIEDGVTGFVCDNVEQMVLAVGKLNSLDRANSRSVAENRFSKPAIVSQYEDLYV